MVLIERSVEAPRSPSIAAGDWEGRLKEALNQLCPVSEDTQQDFERCVV
jgi:hypothetical protein